MMRATFSFTSCHVAPSEGINAPTGTYSIVPLGGDSIRISETKPKDYGKDEDSWLIVVTGACRSIKNVCGALPLFEVPVICGRHIISNKAFALI